ncbi:MAG: globin domain-containing protein [Actinomycetota bacterium]|nr:globin domain-containing protein [Actinomycetota bacterium]MDP9485090.1 globin domain-containing protein [Actinomycetota bacterium]
MATTVTVRQKELVQSTWKRVIPISKTAPTLFYARLFELDPQLRALFPAGERSMKAQHLKLMQMIHICVRGLDQLDRIVPAVQNLGRRHVGYGARNGDYDTVGVALLWTLEQGLGDAFDDEVKEAWASVYGVLAATMIGAANEAPQRSGYKAGAEEGVPMEAMQRPGYARPQADAPEGPGGDAGDDRVRGGEAVWRAAEATQATGPALYGMGIVDEVSGQIGQVDLLQTGLNVLVKVNSSGTINEANEGMEIVTGVPAENLCWGPMPSPTSPGQSRPGAGLWRPCGARPCATGRWRSCIGRARARLSPLTSSRLPATVRPAASCSVATGKTR